MSTEFLGELFQAFPLSSRPIFVVSNRSTFSKHHVGLQDVNRATAPGEPRADISPTETTAPPGTIPHNLLPRFHALGTPQPTLAT